MKTSQMNWAGNYQYTAPEIHYPKNLEEIQELVQHAKKIRALGTRHCFNDIADSSQYLVSLENLENVISLDKERLTVTVEGGIRYGQLSQYLHQEGYALHNLASLPHRKRFSLPARCWHPTGVRIYRRLR